VNMSPYRLSMDCPWTLRKVARPAGLEPATPGLEGRCSIRTELRAQTADDQCNKSQTTAPHFRGPRGRFAVGGPLPRVFLRSVCRL
jgi:hypothetical protein